jgi:hypothetical protein
VYFIGGCFGEANASTPPARRAAAKRSDIALPALTQYV